MSVVALILAVFAMLTLMTGIFPIFFGSLALLFAILGKGNNLRMDAGGKITTTLATICIVLGIVVTAVNIYAIKHDPEAKAAVNNTFQQIYGVDFDTYWEGWQKYYETGEMPDFMKNGNDPGKVDML
jgi:hypothetical protein